MSSNPRAHISADILRIMDSVASYEDIGVGGTVVVTAIDAKTDERNELRLQLVSLTRESNRPKAVFSVLNDDFWFFAENGEPFGTLPIGTLVIGGLAMRHLPEPVAMMVGFGGVDKGRDFSLEDPDGESGTVIIHQISELSTIKAVPDFQAPANLPEFLAKQETMSKQRNEEGNKANEEWKVGVIAEMRELFGPGAEQICAELQSCSAGGVAEIANFLTFANEQGKLEKALEVLKVGFTEQFFFQPPSVRADPEIGSNRDCFRRMYSGAGVVRGEAPSNENVAPSDNADDHYLTLHTILTNWDLSQFEEVSEVKIADLRPGQIVLAETRSGNRYLLEAADPDNMLCNSMNLKCRPGFPEDGYMPGIKCSNIFVRNQMITSEFHSSQIEHLYLQK